MTPRWNVSRPLGQRSPNYVYVASSWRNPLQVAVCAALRVVGIEHYDFRHPEGGGSDGFHWREVMPSWDDDIKTVPTEEYLTALQHPKAAQGFDRDMDALLRADCVIGVLPCGRSSHLEVGWAAGHDIPTAMLLEEPSEPELMYLMCDYLAPSLIDLLGWLGVED